MSDTENRACWCESPNPLENMGCIPKFVIDLGVSCEFEKFLMEIKYIQERNYLEEKIRSTFPVFKVDKNNICSPGIKVLKE